MKLYTILETILKSDSSNLKLIDNQGDLMLNKIHDLVDKTDEHLIGLLLENQELREKFFFKIKKVYVFRTNDFKFFLDENKIDNSYTQYENRIGLTADGKYLKDSSDVVLDFPYKDCILEGGQSTEEGTDTYFEWNTNDNHYQEKKAKRKEIFFNTILAKDEIDRLLEPKAFTNFKHYTSSSDKSRLVPTFERDENGTIKDNLIIKGNNLLALHTLKSEFAGKVKLIYIDPPYNTGNDSFAYNDNFNHSTWLTFMRNRLLIAKELLREDGVIYVHCDDNEHAYLKILMENIFKGMFLNTIIVKAKSTSGASGGGEDKKIKKNTEYIHIFRVSEDFERFNDQFIKTELFDYIDNLLKEGKTFSYTNVLFKEGVKEYVTSTKDGRGDEIKVFKHIDYEIKTINAISKDENLTIKEAYYKYIDKIFTTENSQTSIRERVAEVTRLNDGLFTIEYVPISGRNKGLLTNVSFIGKTKRLVSFLKESCEFDKKKILKKIKLGTLWSDMSWSSVSFEGGVKLKNGKKPEALIQRIIEMTTNENDIVLDYHLGSGTTAAVAHKMKRQYIGIEQLDYRENDSVLRLQNVINNDQTGISKSVNWQGGGSFLYLELAKNNQNAIEYIQSCESYEALIAFFDKMCNTYFLNYNVKVKDFREVICKEENFKKLTLEQQKIMFAKMLDLNQLYVNVSDMKDSQFGLSKNDIAITKDFYQI